jgi:hypothetical protein
MRQIHLVLLILCVLFLGLAAGALWYYHTYPPAEAPTVNYAAQYQAAQDLGRQGKLDEAVQELETIVHTAPPIDSANIHARFALGFDLFSRNQGDDRINAVAIYKELIADRSISNLRRAIATGLLVDLYNASLDDAFATRVIFSGEPFGSLLQNGDIRLAVRRAYETAEALYPLSLHEFRIANWYATQLTIGQATPQEQAELFSQLKQWTEKAEANLPAFLKLGYPKSMFGYLYEMQGRDRTVLATFSDKNYAPAEAAFKRSIAILVADNRADSYDILLLARVYYAAMLANAYGESRRSDIVGLLQAVMSPPPPQLSGYHFLFFEALRNVGPSTSTSMFTKNLTRLVALVPEFRTFLETQGLKY